MQNKEKLYNAITKSLHQTIDYAGDLMQENLEAVRYNWPRRTRRRNGQTVFSPRDAVDTRELYHSQYRSKRRFSGTIGYSAVHAVSVHEGEPELDRPDRPWIKLTVEERGQDIKQNFADNLRNNLS
ncbi:MAG: hypothetical protein AB4372_37065 [Xenococcus sp. (in: cyanobacteria)]